MTETTRFAPSPTGLLHLGHAHSALFAREQAAGGRFILRIEDIDTLRCKPEFVTALEEDLRWLGLDWQQPVRRQSEHFADYGTALARLRDKGLIYPCFCTRADIAASPGAPHGPDGPLYPGTCRSLDATAAEQRIAAGENHALRIDVARALAMTGALTWHDLDAGEQPARPDLLGDVVLARKDTPASYHLAVTVDDALQGISLVTRGQDLFHATHMHRLLQALLDLPVPRWRHHKLMVDAQGRRYAKRDRALTLRALRETGSSPDEVRRLAGF